MTQTPRTRDRVARPGPATVIASCLGLALGVAALVDNGPFQPAGPNTLLLPLIALAYLGFGAARGAFRRPGSARRQVAGVLLFTGLALAALLADPAVGRYVLAAGFVGHAAWDYAHRDGSVVPRWFVDFCVPFDLLVAVSLVVSAA
ncbi:MAG TPA: hypothetical protein VES42_24955 [Pilimelia sp.]|nr:hypothetical protein [Pilimelia sp.]